MDKDFHHFSGKELSFQKSFRTFRDRLFGPLARVLIRYNVSPNLLTLLSFASIGGFVYFAFSEPLVAVTFLLFHIIIDGLDGPVARAQGKTGKAGALMDILNDHTGLVIVVATLTWHALLEPTLGVLYTYVYTLLVCLTLYRNQLRIPAALSFRSRYPLYGLYGWWALTQDSLFDEAVFAVTLATVMLVLIDIRAIYIALNKR